MKEFKYTIDGKEYKVQIDAVEGNIASVNVNGEAYKVEMEQEAEPEKKKVVLGQPAAASDDAEATPAANVNTANAVKAPLPGYYHQHRGSCWSGGKGRRYCCRSRGYEDAEQHRG